MTSDDESIRRQARILSLRLAGLTFEGIAQQEAREDGTPQRSAQAISDDLGRALAERKEQLAAHVLTFVTLENERLDRLQRTAENILRSATAAPCQSCGRSPEPKLALQATDRLMRIGERRQALLRVAQGKGQGDAVDEIAERRRRKIGLSG